MVSELHPLVASGSGGNAAFFVVFGIFIVALAVLGFLTLRWAFRADRAGFKLWRERQQLRQQPHVPGPNAGPEEGQPPAGP